MVDQSVVLLAVYICNLTAVFLIHMMMYVFVSNLVVAFVIDEISVCLGGRLDNLFAVGANCWTTTVRSLSGNRR